MHLYLFLLRYLIFYFLYIYYNTILLIGKLYYTAWNISIDKNIFTNSCFIKKCIFFFQVKLTSGHRAPPAALAALIHPALIALVAYHRAAAAAAQLHLIDALNAASSSIARIVSIIKLILTYSKIEFLETRLNTACRFTANEDFLRVTTFDADIN